MIICYIADQVSHLGAQMGLRVVLFVVSVV